MTQIVSAQRQQQAGVAGSIRSRVGNIFEQCEFTQEVADLQDLHEQGRVVCQTHRTFHTAASNDIKAPRRCSFFDQYRVGLRSEEHTSELQSLMRISYAVFCLKKTKTK